MFFEGSEKKIELVIADTATSLRSYDRSFWDKIVGLSSAQILSVIENDHCSAYLLSESSLFVFDRHLVMLTCGKTSLADAALELLKNIPHQDICAFFFERKHEVFPRKQPTTFFNDIEKLEKTISQKFEKKTSGKGYRFGDEDEHHLYMYHLNKDYIPEENDVTLEILMHGVYDKEKLFVKPQREDFYQKTKVDNLLPNFKIDDYFFDPHGYSLNAIKESEYYTVHVTPQEVGAYVSFETNYNYRKENNLEDVVTKVLELFRPKSFDIVLFDPKILRPIVLPEYILKSEVVETISCGYNVGYFSYFSKQKKPEKAFNLDISKITGDR